MAEMDMAEIDIEDIGKLWMQDRSRFKCWNFNSTVLISGMNSLGAEIAKNLILAGMRAVILHDECLVELCDLSSSFILTEEDIGKNRATASVQKLQELNKFVKVSALSTELNLNQLSGLKVVVFTDISLEKAIEVNQYCHTHWPPIAFIKADVRGLFGRLFCDFGANFSVSDPIHSDGRGEARKVKSLKCKLLVEAIAHPGDVSPLLHLAFQALDTFFTRHGCLPVAGSELDAEEVISIVRCLNEGERKLENINAKLLQQFAFGARAMLSPMASIFGGIVGQEVVKACSQNFCPIELFYYESLESLSREPVEACDFKGLNSNYDAQISVFGSQFQQKLEQAKILLVGCGSLGCELLKNLVFMGVSRGKKGKLTIADHDVIRRGDLSSNLLFREGNTGQLKATVAADSFPADIEALAIRVHEDTENVLNDCFWEKYDVVISALDSNFDANLYVEQRCLKFQKPFLVSETLGTHCCTTQVVIPNMTESFSRSTVHNIRRSIATSSATSSAMAAGFVCLELYKVLGGGHQIDEYRNVNAMLDVPSAFSMAAPAAAKVTSYRELEWTVWDRWVIKGNPTVEEVSVWLATKGLEALSLSCQNKMICDFYTEGNQMILKMTVLELVRDVMKLEIPVHRHHVDLKAACVDIDHTDTEMLIDIPLLSVFFQ